MDEVSEQQRSKVLSYRWVCLVTLWLVYFFVYFDRVAPAVVAPELMKAFNISAASMGLLSAAPEDWEWRTAIVEALHGFDMEGCARQLFGELRAVKGSNTTRRYRDAVLKTLATLSAGLTRAGFAAMLEDPTCSQRTRDKVLCILNGVADR